MRLPLRAARRARGRGVRFRSRSTSRAGSTSSRCASCVPPGSARCWWHSRSSSAGSRPRACSTPRRKRPLPRYPRRARDRHLAGGCCGARHGHGDADALAVDRHRARAGAGAGTDRRGEIAAAIQRFNRYAKVDLLIVGRGGGSLEDLWAFNEEIVVARDRRLPDPGDLGSRPRGRLDPRRPRRRRTRRHAVERR